MMITNTRNRRRIKPLFITLLVSMLLTVVAWGQSLDKGTYTITNTVVHDNPVGQGMARSYTEEKMDVEVDDSGTYVTLGFNNTQFMGEFTIKVDGSTVSYDVVSDSNNIKKLKFKVPSLDSKISVSMYVVPMDTNVEYTVTLNSGSLTLVKKAETVVTETETPKAPTATKPSTTTTKPETTTPVVAEDVKKAETVKSESVKTDTAKIEVQKETGAKVETKADKNDKADKVDKVETQVAKADAKLETQEEAKKDVKESTEIATSEEKAVEEITEEMTEETIEEPIEEIIEESTQEATEETIEETEKTEVETEANSIGEEISEDTSSSSPLLLVGVGITVVAAIGLVVYFKRK